MSGSGDARINKLYFEQEHKKAQRNAMLARYGNPTLTVTPFVESPETAENVERLRKFLNSPQFWDMLMEHWEEA